jgi:hypothetical protein
MIDEQCSLRDIRAEVESRLKLPLPLTKNETAFHFWKLVEQAGMLIEALTLYDRIAAERTPPPPIRRETKLQFLERIDREGRRAEVERLRAELLASGWSQRDAQAELVKRFQPSDGTSTRAWETPDPWENGRLFRTKAKEQELEALTRDEEDDQDAREYEREAAAEELLSAHSRFMERSALAKARRRARELKSPTAVATSG